MGSDLDLKVLVKENKDKNSQNLSIEEKILLARKICRMRDRFLDSEIESLLSKLNRAIEESKAVMEETGVSDACRECGDVSCCGEGIENRYEVTTLLINLLMGVELSKGDATGCYFLTTSGCSLKAREVICVNYLCEKIHRRLDIEKLIAVQETCGKELDIFFSLSELIKKKIRNLER